MSSFMSSPNHSSIHGLDQESSQAASPINQPSSKDEVEKIPLSVVVLTKNEADFIGRCLKSVDWADETLILDSGSTDQTRAIAAALGAVVHEQAWLGWSTQHNRAIALAKHDWVLVLDADEIVTRELAESIQRVMRQPKDDRDGYSLDRRHDFHGVLIPDMRRRSKRLNFIRLFNRRHGAFDPTMTVHEEVRVSGKAIPLAGILLHWRGRTIDENLTVANQNGTLEAEALNRQGYRVKSFMIVLRPILRFFWCYIVKGGFRVGVPGLNYAMIRAINEYACYAKLWEIQNAPRMIHPPPEIYADSPVVDRSVSSEPSGRLVP